MSVSGEQVMEASLDELFAIAEQKSRQIRVSITQNEASVENVKALNLPSREKRWRNSMWKRIAWVVIRSKEKNSPILL